MLTTLRHLKEAYSSLEDKDSVIVISGAEFYGKYLGYLIEHLEKNEKVGLDQVIQFKPQSRSPEAKL